MSEVQEFGVAEKGGSWLWDICRTAERAENLKAEREFETSREYEIITDFDAWMLKAEDSYLEPANAITLEDWDRMLNILPPLQWHMHAGAEVFCMIEFLYGSITTQYGRVGDLCAAKNVRYGDRKTYLTGDQVRAANAPEV